MNRKSIMLTLAAVLAFATATAQAQDERSYTEGPVVAVSYIKTMPGMFDEYMRYLAGTYKKIMEEQKKAGIILDYAVYSAVPRTPEDPDLILTVTYANMAALDNLDEKTDAITRTVWGTLSKSAQASADRGKMREQLGGDLIRQLVLK